MKVLTPHIFRKYRGGYNPNDIKCWSPTSVISTDNFDIENTAFARGASKAATSIPSPLARMELFDTAFHIVSDPKNNLIGNTIYHQLVSDCLDVMQLLFNSKNSEIGFDKKIWFKEWKVKENIDLLRSKGENHPHNLLAMSFEQVFFDNENPRFSTTDSIFLIYYENKLVGGTSPLTLFFTSPNWTRYIKNNEIGNIPGASSPNGYDDFFDNGYKALQERDPLFIEYVFKLILSNRDKFTIAEGFRKYVNSTIDSNGNQFANWRNKFSDYSSQKSNGLDDENNPQQNKIDLEYSKLKTTIENKHLSVNGIFFHHIKEEDKQSKVRNYTDFTIRANSSKLIKGPDGDDDKEFIEYYNNGIVYTLHPPLVLLQGMDTPGDYTDKNSPWDKNTVIKDFWVTNIPLNERKLPQGLYQTFEYPFISIQDFLEDNLIELPFKINNSRFYSGCNTDFKYLLPIKKEYFNFFTLDDLKKQLIIRNLEDRVEVELNIPIKNKKKIPSISFVKTYKKGKNIIADTKFGLGIFPFYKVKETEAELQKLNDYTILLADKNDSIQLESLEFYKFSDVVKKQPLNVGAPVVRSTKSLTAGSSYYNVNGAFDLIELGIKEEDFISTGLIIPEWQICKTVGTGKQFFFAIDFGTSNTHISFTAARDNKNPLPFEINSENEMQVVLLNKPNNEIKDFSKKYREGYGSLPDIDLIVNREFLPLVFGGEENSDFYFPIRTATCEKSDFKSNTTSLFGNANIGFYIDHEQSKPDSVVYTTNLKWLFENNAEDASNTKRIDAFFTEILLLIRNKIILNNGEIKESRICWMKPQSMGQAINEQLITEWENAYKKVFKDILTIMDYNPISESLAPYFYFKFGPDGNFKNRAADSINIDIGGGTTDVIYLNKKTNTYISTSFRFAANDIWGSGIVPGLKDNGYIKNFLIFNDKNKRNRTDADNILDSFLKNPSYKSEDIISILFKYDNVLKFTESIKRNNPELLFILYLHYSSIIYHVVQLLESKEMEVLPKYFTFTGKGSQYVRMMCVEDKLTEFTTLLLKSFTNMKIDNGFKVILTDNPKETTANGGVLFLTANEGDKIYLKEENELIHFGGDYKYNSNFRKGYTPNEKAISNKDFNQSVLKNQQNFIDKLLKVETDGKINEERLSIVKFLKSYNIKNVNNYYDLLTNGDCSISGSMINDSYDSYIDNLSASGTQEISETFFFYGLKDTLYQLSKTIMETK